MADLATARAAARLLTAHLDGDPTARAAELTTTNPAALADATAELAAHMLAELTPPGRPGQIPLALIHALAAYPAPLGALYAARLFEGG